MDSYFFVPANLTHRIPFIKESKPDYIIIDLEDSIKNSQRELMLEAVSSLENKEEYFFRVPVHNYQDKLSFDYLEKFIALGLKQFVIPKLDSFHEFLELNKLLKDDFKVILLIESPRLFLELNNLLSKEWPSLYGMGLGSHDLMAKIGGEHSLLNLEYYRIQILTLARALNIQAIDIASMELTDEQTIIQEIIDGFKKGYDAKFLIHPKQLNLQRSIDFYTENDMEWAQTVLNVLADLTSENEFNPVVINGQVIEKPHLSKAKKIIRYKEKIDGK